MNDQGNHSIMVADADNDGKDEIIFGSSALNDDGKIYWVNGNGHGDANHIGDMDPSRPGLELWLVKEGAVVGGIGSYMADAATGKAIWNRSVAEDTDVGRGLAADIDATHVGYEMWSSATDGTYNCKNQRISTSKGSVNFRVYWDGDLQDELLDGNKIDKWNGNGTTRLATLNGNSCNGSKATPNFSGDILGDWREEVILHDGASKLYLYTTTISTTHRLYTLMHDPQYRAQISSEQSAYNQPPHLSFFLGNGADKAPKPNMYVSGKVEIQNKPVSGKQLNAHQSIRKMAGNQILQLDNSIGVYDIAIYDLSGQIVKNVSTSENSVYLKKMGIVEGMYIVKTSVLKKR